MLGMTETDRTGPLARVKPDDESPAIFASSGLPVLSESADAVAPQEQESSEMMKQKRAGQRVGQSERANHEELINKACRLHSQLVRTAWACKMRFGANNDLGAQFKNPRFAQILSTIKWKYRGQINPLNRQMSLDVHITKIIKEQHRVTIIGDANLSKDGLRIYEVFDVAICIEEA